MSKSKLDIVDENDNVIGQDSRENIHDKGLLHRAVSVIVFNSKKDIVFQKRSKNKDIYPGLLSASAGGGVDLGEAYEEAALRELMEETGIEAEASELIFFEKLRRRNEDRLTGKINNTFTAVFGYRFKGDLAEFKIEAGHIDRFESWSLEKILNLSQDSKKFVPSFFDEDFLRQFRKIQQIINYQQMELSRFEKKIQQDAIDYIKSHSKELVERFILSKKPIRLDALTFFMAGSPGAGKTEFSRRYMSPKINKKDKKLVNFLRKSGVDVDSSETIYVRIDVDEVRDFIPQYQKTDIKNCISGNAHIIQKAANKGLDILREYCFKNSISFLHDGTFGNYGTMRELVERSIKAQRDVQIFYIYLDPLVAWEFTKAREFLEGRNIVKEKFVEQFFASRENVARIKAEFGKKVRLHCIIKNDKNEPASVEFNVSDIDKMINSYYNRKLLSRYSGDDLLKLLNDI